MTTSQPPNEPFDDAQLPGEAELLALYRQLPLREPDAALDASVLRAAAQAIGVDESPSAANHSEAGESPRGSDNRVHPKAAAAKSVHRVRRPPRWLISLSTAATLVLAGGIAWHMRDVPNSEAVPVSSSAAQDSVMPTEQTPSAPSVKQAQMPPPPPMPAMKIAPASPRVHASNKRAASGRAISTNNIQADHQDRIRASKPLAAPKIMPPVIPPPAPQQAGMPTPAPMPIPMPMPPPAPPAPPAPPPVQEISTNAISPARPAPAASGLAASRADASAEKSSPDHARELDSIRRLFDTHQDGEAQRRLLKFRRSYPHYHLPPDLRAHLPQP